jgi:hypothetical protein
MIAIGTSILEFDIVDGIISIVTWNILHLKIQVWFVTFYILARFVLLELEAVFIINKWVVN